MTQSFSLPLRPLIQKESKPDSLPIRIAQINAQRGSFRNVTEQSLQAEIGALRSSDDSAAEIGDPKAGEGEASDRQEHLFRSRNEILEFARKAHAEAIYALDFVSLLVSKHNPRQAELSMSSYLKQQVPLGSLGIDVARIPEHSTAAQQDIQVVSRGWKLGNFDSAATKLLQSACRLEEEVAAETRYWAEVLAVKEKGWKICRLPREKQTLGVQFGFLEATPTFVDRGLAALRRGEGGHLILDQGLRASRPRVVRVRVQRDNQILGSSKLRSVDPTDLDSIESRIHQARDALYEEELFHELNREARVLLHHGVETRHNLVHFRSSDTEQILIDLVDPDDAESAEDQGPCLGPEATLADSVALCLRVLLSYAHRQNLQRRSRIPPPLTLKKRASPEYLLLRPIACYLQHKSHFQWIDSFLDDFTRTLQRTGLKSSYTTTPLTSVDLSLSRTKRHLSSSAASTATVEAIVETFLGPLESILTGTFLSPTTSFKIRVLTNLAPNALGTEFEISTNLPCLSATQSSSRFGLREELEEFLTYLFTLDLVFLIPSLAGNSNANLTAPDDRGQEDQSDSDPFDDEPPYSSAHAKLLAWDPMFPEHGELTAYSPARRCSKKLIVELSRDQFVLRTRWMGGPEVGDEDQSNDEGGQGRSPNYNATKTNLHTDESIYSWRLDHSVGDADEMEGVERESEIQATSGSIQDVLRLVTETS